MAKSRRRPSGNVTIRDVASAAGVSVTTVSNVLNGRTNAMGEETLARVQAAMRAVNYRPNGLARSMVTRRSQTLGLVLVEVDTPLFLRALSVVEPIARSAGFNLLLYSAAGLAEEIEAIELLREKQVEGIAFISTSHKIDDSHIVALQAGGMPVMLVNRSTHGEAFDSVYWDNVRGTADTVRHLFALGHRRIGFFTGPTDRRSSDERLSGYLAGLQECELALDAGLIREADYTAERGTWERATGSLLALPQPATAIIASDDTVAAVAMRTIRRLGLSVPADVSVVGVDDQPFCTCLDPTLTTLRLPILEASEIGCKLLLERIAGRDEAGRRVLLPCELIVRESTGPAPSDGAVMESAAAASAGGATFAGSAAVVEAAELAGRPSARRM